MTIFTILAAIAMFLVGGVTLVALTIVLWRVRQRPWRATLLWVGVSLVPMVAFFVLFSWIFGPVDYISQSDLNAAYRTEFNSDPPADVIDIRARHAVRGDSGAAWIKFRASGKTIDALLPKFVHADRKTFDDAGIGGDVPSWWRPDTDGIDTYYTVEHWNNSFSYSMAYLGVGRSNNIIYFHHSCFD